MKRTVFALMALSVLTIACSDKKKSTDYNPAEHSSYAIQEEPVKPDTVSPQQLEEKPVGTTNISSNRPYITKDKELDNMRGFDPASEDDMDDNGMQRYFDANDDEAWD